MNVSPTLTVQEFKTIHNAVCELDSLVFQLEQVLKPELYAKLLRARDSIRQGLQGAYQQDHDAFDRKGQHYTNVKAELGIRGSDWSIYEVDNLSDRHPFEGADRVVYRDHWGEQPVQCSINGLTWAALWVAANACIRDSGDDHHTFIEAFRPSKDDPRTLVLVTGS